MTSAAARTARRAAVEQFARNPLWERLPGVRDGRVLALPQPIYNGGHHYAAAALLVELAGALG